MFKKMKLTSKLAVVLGICLSVVFTVLIVLTAWMSSTAINTSVTGELTAISSANALEIQQIFDAAADVSTNMKNYLDKAYLLAEEDPSQMEMPTTEEAASMNQSEIYDRTLTSLNYDVELYIRENARNIVATNDDIEGVGVMFEPYAFQEDMKDFAFYVDKAHVGADVEPFGAYETYSAESYYQDAVSAKAAIVTQPYEYNGNRLVTYAEPIIHNGVVQGVVMADINVSNFDKVQATNTQYPSMYSTIYDNTQMIIYDSEDAADVGRNLSEFMARQQELDHVREQMTKGEAFQVKTTREDGRRVFRNFTPVDAGSETWWCLTAVSEADVNRPVVQTVMTLTILSVVTLVLLIAIIVLVLRSMLKHLKPVVEAAEQIANGNLDVQLANTGHDEIGMLSLTFIRMADNLKRIVEDVEYLLGNMADGNFNIRTRAEERYTGTFEELLLSMRKLNKKLSDAFGQINVAADQVSAGSNQVSAGAQALSQGATEQASSVEELAATINEISAQVSENAQKAQEACRVAETTGDRVEDGNRQMKEMIEAMSEISDKSDQIGKIIKTIEDIAFQTNILALNAAVEAARAGEAGKGFAVVADEVRNLAGKSAEASENTSALIEGTIEAVKRGSKLVDGTAQTLTEVVESTLQVVTMIEGISEASNEQAASVEQVTVGIDQISSVVQTNSATAEESAAASEELSGQAEMLKSLVGQFKLRE